MKFVLLTVLLVMSFDTFSKSYSKEEAKKFHLQHVVEKYNPETICMTELRKFDEIRIQEMVITSRVVDRISLFSYKDGNEIVIEESTFPPSASLRVEGRKVRCIYLGK